MSDDKCEQDKINRRQFVKNSAKLAAVAGASSFAPKISFAENQNFDFIVVGAGAGGGPLASNLARKGKKVLLIDAGGDKINNNVKVPAFHALSTEDPLISWHFYVDHYANKAKQKLDSKYVNGKGILYPRAQGLGGCTLHHAMITMYPDNEDWNNIARVTGDSSWNALTMRTYFERLERNRYVSNSLANPGRFGFNGWLPTEQNNVRLGFKEKALFRFVLAAAAQEGLLKEFWEILRRRDLSFKLDPNDWRFVKSKHNGLFNTPKSTYNGQRMGPRERILATKKLYPQNLTIKTHTLVKELIFDANDRKKVIGVKVQEGKHLYSADLKHSNGFLKAGKEKVYKGGEVILCGGAFNTPQMLMLSGIGDPYHLRQVGIDVRHPLPGVGKNLQDRYEVTVSSELYRPIKTIKRCLFGATNDPCLKDYKVDPSKSVYSTNGVAIGLIRKSKSTTQGAPDLYIFGTPGYFKGYEPGWAKRALKANQITWTILKGHTKNTNGEVKLKSKKYWETPSINFKYFDEGNDRIEEDLKGVLEGVNFARKINKSIWVRPRIKKESVPGKAYKTQSQLKQFIKNEAWGHHASCSCKMGHKNDPNAVVDTNFRVRGIKNLRIVDASVFPKTPGLFIVLPIYMISEKAADVILKRP